MHATSYERLEYGEANSELRTVVRIATAFNLDPSTLMAGMFGAEMLPARFAHVTYS